MIKWERMFSYIFIFNFSLFIFNFSVIWAEEKAEREYTLKQAIDSALRNNPFILSKQRDISIAEQQIREAVAMFLPTLDFGVHYTFLNINKPLVLPLQLGGATLEPEKAQYYAGSFSFYQPIYSGGRLPAVKKQAEISFTKAKASYEQSKNEVIAEVKNKFYVLLLNQQLIDFLKREIEEGEHRELEEIDLSRQKIWLNQLKCLLAEKQQRLKVTQTEFNRTIGIDLSVSVKVDGQLVFNPQEIDLQKSYAWGAECRPELLLAQAEQEVDMVALNLALLQKYPSISLGGSYERSGSEFPWNFRKWFQEMGENWTATVAFTLPIFRGGAGGPRVRQHRQRLEKARYEKSYLATRIQEEIKKAYLEYFSASKRKELQAENLQLARERMQQMITLYGKGERSFLEFLDAEEIFVQTNLEYLTNICRCLVAKTELERATGKEISNEE